MAKIKATPSLPASSRLQAPVSIGSSVKGKPGSNPYC